MSNGLVSSVMVNNLVTMEICKKHDPRQEIGSPYEVPAVDVRLLRGQLLLEETLETIAALGLEMVIDPDSGKPILIPKKTSQACDLEKIIDGACDTIYVATGVLAACGVYDIPHLQEVCDANYDKFPNGEAIVNENGKYMKPEGWEPPNHKAVQISVQRQVTLREFAAHHLTGFKTASKKVRKPDESRKA